MQNVCPNGTTFKQALQAMLFTKIRNNKNNTCTCTFFLSLFFSISFSFLIFFSFFINLDMILFCLFLFFLIQNKFIKLIKEEGKNALKLANSRVVLGGGRLGEGFDSLIWYSKVPLMAG